MFQKKLKCRHNIITFIKQIKTMQDFTFIKDTQSRNLVINGYHAVSRCESWNFLKNFKPNNNEGFMFTDHPKVYEIGHMMESCPHPPGHSGCSFAWTMRQLESIAKDGYQNYKNSWIAREEQREVQQRRIRLAQEVANRSISVPEIPPVLNENLQTFPEIPQE
uniref:Uncharacterized protein n=1 Tax=viral metagenome TaxID=1070528 RepID=A0A6C0DI59_9ZZZZ